MLAWYSDPIGASFRRCPDRRARCHIRNKPPGGGLQYRLAKQRQCGSGILFIPVLIYGLTEQAVGLVLREVFACGESGYAVSVEVVRFCKRIGAFGSSAGLVALLAGSGCKEDRDQGR